jgi:hypothetical protein
VTEKIKLKVAQGRVGLETKREYRRGGGGLTKTPLRYHCYHPIFRLGSFVTGYEKESATSSFRISNRGMGSRPKVVRSLADYEKGFSWTALISGSKVRVLVRPPINQRLSYSSRMVADLPEAHRKHQAAKIIVSEHNFSLEQEGVGFGRHAF